MVINQTFVNLCCNIVIRIKGYLRSTKIRKILWIFNAFWYFWKVNFIFDLQISLWKALKMRKYLKALFHEMDKENRNRIAKFKILILHLFTICLIFWWYFSKLSWKLGNFYPNFHLQLETRADHECLDVPCPWIRALVKFLRRESGFPLPLHFPTWFEFLGITLSAIIKIHLV